MAEDCPPALREGSCWFAFPTPTLFSSPTRVLAAWDLSSVLPVVAAAEAAALAGSHVCGMLAYEAGPAFEPSQRVSPTLCIPGFPLAWFAVYAQGQPCPAPPSAAARGGAEAPAPSAAAAPAAGAWVPSIDRATYDASIASLRGSIRDGEVYQVNLTLRLRAPWTAPPEEDGRFLAALLRAQRCSYGAYLHMGRHRVLSASPELFFRWSRGDASLTALPMKGTRPRGLHAAEDAAAAADLASSTKDAAENLMIVDLLRNDMGRLALPGSVEVTELFKVEAFPTVWQMTSRVSSRMPPGVGLVDILRALFPCGSITGAPKISAMKVIAELEGSSRSGGRGVYCGALLHLSPGQAGTVTASVPIRTLLLDGQEGCAVYGIGGGVVWDSSASGEWEEAQAKAAVLHAACRNASAAGREAGQQQQSLPPSLLTCEPRFELLETLRYSSQLGRYLFLEEHCARLQSSAEFLGFPWDGRAVEECLAGAAEGACGSCGSCRSGGGGACCASGGDKRVRLTLSKAGTLTATSELLRSAFIASAQDSESVAPQAVLLARIPVHSRHPFLYHKSTEREVYRGPREDALQAHPRAGSSAGAPPPPHS